MPDNHRSDSRLLSLREVAGEISLRLRQGRPMSFVRLGDGEGGVLAIDEASTLDDLQHLNAHFGGSGFSLGDVFRLRDELRAAATDADLVGVRDDVFGVPCEPELFALDPEDFEREFKQRFPLRACDTGLPYHACRRLALLNQALRHMEFPVSSRFASAWVHWELAASGQLFRWIAARRHIGVITARAGLAARLEEIFQVEVTAYPVPDMYRDSHPKIPGAHFPVRFEQLRSQLQVDHPGMLFLVGAGVCGKIYCRWIKERGGAALDIGAVLDAWAGIGSRPAVFRDKFRNAAFTGKVPSDLLLDEGTVRRLLSQPELLPG